MSSRKLGPSVFSEPPCLVSCRMSQITMMMLVFLKHRGSEYTEIFCGQRHVASLVVGSPIA